MKSILKFSLIIIIIYIIIIAGIYLGGAHTKGYDCMYKYVQSNTTGYIFAYNNSSIGHIDTNPNKIEECNKDKNCYYIGIMRGCKIIDSSLNAFSIVTLQLGCYVDVLYYKIIKNY